MRILKSKIKSGFTLIELLIVIIIIGILATLAFVSYASADRQARDAQRRNDIAQYRNLLQEFSINNGTKYPYLIGYETTAQVLNSASGFCNTYFNVNPCLSDVNSGLVPSFGGLSYDYRYTSNQTSYVLYARLEESNNCFWMACSNGRIGKNRNVPVLTPFDGTCPLDSAVLCN